MDSNGFVITKETWEHMPQDQRDWILFDTMQRLTADVKGLKRWKTCSGFLGGMVGGALAFLGMKIGG